MIGRFLPVAVAVVALAGCASSATPAYSPPDPSPTFAATGECKVDPDVLPDPTCTPGTTGLAVVNDGPAYASTLCRDGWDPQPPADYTAAVMRWQLLGDRSGRATIARRLGLPANQVHVRVYGAYAGGGPRDYGMDLLIPAAFGGNADPSNVWPMPSAALKEKVALEAAARRWVCGAPVNERPGRVGRVQGMMILNWRQLAELSSASG